MVSVPNAKSLVWYSDSDDSDDSLITDEEDCEDHRKVSLDSAGGEDEKSQQYDLVLTKCPVGAVEKRKTSSDDQMNAPSKRGKITKDRSSDKPLQLPDAIVGMFKDQSTEDSLGLEVTEEHCGKIRSFPHFSGNWATFLFIPVKSNPSFVKLVNKMVERTMETLPDLTPAPELHISVSRTVPIRHYWIEPMIHKFQKAFICNSSFICHLDVPEFYTNDENTRTFLGLRIIVGEEKIQQLVQVTDQVFREFGLPEYYTNPSFHVSIAWHLGDVMDLVSESLKNELQDGLDSFTDDDEKHRGRDLLVNKVCLKAGNKMYQFSLR